MRVVAVVSLLLVCSVLAPSAVLAEPVTSLGATTLNSADVGDEPVAAVQSTENGSSQSNQSSGSLGLQVSSFVQSTTAETNGVVENEMWEANVNRSGRSAEVTRRVDRLDRRVTSLRERRQSLTNEYENENLSTLRYRAQLAQLNGELNALSAAASSTERAATRFNTSPRGLSKVRTEIQRSRAETPPLGRFADGDVWSNRSNTTRGGPSDRWERNASNRSFERPTSEERGTAGWAVERNRSGGGLPSNETRAQRDEKRPDNARESNDTSSDATSNRAANAEREADASTNRNTTGSAANTGNSTNSKESERSANRAKGNRSRSR